MLSKERWISAILFILCIPTLGIPIYLGWINTADLITQTVAGLVVAMATAGAVLWYHGKPKTQTITVEEPRIHLNQHAFVNKLMVKFDLEVIAGQEPIDALEVLVAYGYPFPMNWTKLDLREYSFTEVETGKSGNPIQRISLLSHDVKSFTFVTIWYKDKWSRILCAIRTVDSISTEPNFVNFLKVPYLPHLRLYARFIGLQKQVEKEYIIGYNEPPWQVGSNIPSREPIELVDVDSKRGRELIVDEERKYGEV